MQILVVKLMRPKQIKLYFKLKKVISRFLCEYIYLLKGEAKTLWAFLTLNPKSRDVRPREVQVGNLSSLQIIICLIDLFY